MDPVDVDDNTKLSVTIKKSSLVHEIHDNFDQVFSTEASTHDASKSVGFQNPVSVLSAHIQKSTADEGFSPKGACYFNSNFDENGYVFDGVKIEIEDIDNTSMSNITTVTLKRCKEQVLKRYHCLLCFIGWRPFFKEDYYRTPWFWTVFNVLYPVIIVAFLFFSYCYEVLTCQGKLNVAIDALPIQPAHRVNTTISSIVSTRRFFEYERSTKNYNFSASSNEYSEQCGHVFTTYIIPSIMHLASYILGFIYFRINENETLYALMEKVFLAVDQSNRIISQDRVIRRLKIFIILGLLWVILEMCVQTLSRALFRVKGMSDLFEPEWLVIALQVISLIMTNSVYLAVVINHSTQCEMIIFYVNEIKIRLEEKSIALKDAMQQILDIRIALNSLNSTTAKMTSLVSLTFLEKFIIGLIILVMNKNQDAWTYRSLFVFSWFVILSFTVIQPARLNSILNKFKHIALSARVYGYHNSSRDELDSFLLFISNANLRAKLFGLTMKPAFILGSVICITFTLIILFQTSIITSPESFI